MFALVRDAIDIRTGNNRIEQYRSTEKKSVLMHTRRFIDRKFTCTPPNIKWAWFWPEKQKTFISSFQMIRCVIMAHFFRAIVKHHLRQSSFYMCGKIWKWKLFFGKEIFLFVLFRVPMYEIKKVLNLNLHMNLFSVVIHTIWTLECFE